MLKSELEALVKEQKKQIKKLEKETGIPERYKTLEDFRNSYPESVRHVIDKVIAEKSRVSWVTDLKGAVLQPIRRWKIDRLNERLKALTDMGYKEYRAKGILEFEANQCGIHWARKERVSSGEREHALSKLPPRPW